MEKAIVRFLGTGDAFGSDGRFQACILVETGPLRFLLDCGATSLTAMKRRGVDPSDIDAVVVSHYHGDHYGGIPFLILDGQFRHRTRSLAILGPGNVEQRVLAAMETAFPGSSAATRRFEVAFHRLTIGAGARLGDVAFDAFPAVHTPGSDPICVRVSAGGTVLAYSGDTEWTDSLPVIAAGADLLICEAYSWDKPIRYHISHRTLMEHRAELAARRIVLTHFGPEMLAHLPDASEAPAQDGMQLLL